MAHENYTANKAHGSNVERVAGIASCVSKFLPHSGRGLPHELGRRASAHYLSVPSLNYSKLQLRSFDPEVKSLNMI
jgi:hypothetical protein